MKKIGITTSQIIMMDPSLCGYKKMNVTTTYVHAVQKAGGLPIIIPCICSEEEMKQYIELCDGFVLIGGMDIAPVLYGEMPHAKCGAYDYDVDVSQLAFTKLVIESKKPALAICRGMQLVNIALGGTLIQDIPSLSQEINHAFDYDGNIVHTASLDKDGGLYRLLQIDTIAINSLHHQAVGKLGQGLHVDAKAPDGIIEAISLPEQPLLGVQWHPEMMVDTDPLMAKLFRWVTEH